MLLWRIFSNGVVVKYLMKVGIAWQLVSIFWVSFSCVQDRRREGSGKAGKGCHFFRQSGLLAFLQVFISVVEKFEEVGGFGHGETCCCMVVFIRMVLAC